MAYSILRNREDAEDAVQDAILSAHRNSRSFQGRSAFGTWFTRIALNAALMIYRKRKLSRIEPFPACSPEETSWAETTLDGRPDPETLYAENETLQLIDKLLENLSQPLRQAFTMVFYDELTIQEGAAQLGIAAGTFKTRVYRAKKYLINEKHLDLFGPLRKRTDSSFSSCTDDFSFLAKGPSATSAPEAAFS